MTLAPFNTINLTASQSIQLVPPGLGHYNLLIYNDGPGVCYISNLASVGNNATSFILPINQLMPPILVSGGTGIWVMKDTSAGSLSVQLVPRS